MSRTMMVASLLMLCSGCAQQTSPANTPHYPSAAELRQCPFGHTSLKDVHIAYGELLPNPDLPRAIENLEVCVGGCVISEDSPNTRVTCRDCRYSYDPIQRAWWKESSDRSAFRRPLSKLIADAPMPPGSRAHFEQKLDTSGKVVFESIEFSSKGTTLELASPINAHLQKECPMRFEGRTSAFRISRRGKHDDGRIIKYSIENHLEKKEATVYIIAARPDFEPHLYDDLESGDR